MEPEKKELNPYSPEFMESRIAAFYKKKARIFPVNSNYPSRLGYPCLRERVHDRLDWPHRRPFSPDTIALFEEGNRHEKASVELFNNIGYEIIRQQMPFKNKEYNMHGYIDYGLHYEKLSRDNWVLGEFKATNPYTFAKIKTEADVKQEFFPSIWRCQLLIYQWFEQRPGRLIIKDRLTGKIKVIEINFDQSDVDELLRKAKEVNRCVEKNIYPDKINNPAVCHWCSYKHVCMPDEERFPLLSLEDLEFSEQFKRYRELHEAHKEYNRLDKQFKSAMELVEGDKFLYQGYYISRKKVNRSGYTVQPGSYWKYDYEKLEEREKGND